MLNRFLVISLFMLLFLGLAGISFAHNVGQSQTSKFFAPETVKMLQDRAAGVSPGGPGIRTGDVLSYIIESVPSPNGAVLGSAGYITDYIPPGMEVVGANFVTKQPDPFKVGGFAYNNRSANAPGILGDGCGQRGCGGFTAPFLDGNLANGTQDTGIFYSVDVRTSRLTLPYDITACTKSKVAGGQVVFLVYNQWDYDQLMGFGNNQGCNAIAPALYAGTDPTANILGGSGRANPPVMLKLGVMVGMASPVAGSGSFYTGDFNPVGDGVGATNSIADYGNLGPWQRIYAPGSLIGGSGLVVAAIGNGAETITGVPTSAGFTLSTGNPLPLGTNTVRWAIGERAVGTVEYVKISMRVSNVGGFGAGALNNTAFTNHSEVFGGDASGGSQGGKDIVYAYLGPSQANNNAQLMVTKKVVAVSNVSATGPWISSDGAFLAVGQWVKYRLNYLNAASAPLYDLVITDIIDTLEATYVSSDTGNPFIGAATYAAPTLTWPTILQISPGGGGSMEVVVNISGGNGGVITANKVSATADASDRTLNPLPAVKMILSDASMVSNITGANGGANPSISQSKTVTPSVAAVGTNVLYTIVANNNGGAIAVGAMVEGNDDPAKGPVYPGTQHQDAPFGDGATEGGFIIGDKMPATALGVKTITYLNTLSVTLTDPNTGLSYPFAITDYMIWPNVTDANGAGTRTGDVFWEFLYYPVGYPSAATGLALPANTVFDFASGTLQIDFYGQIAATTLPGIHYNQAENYVAIWDFQGNGPDKDANRVVPNTAPVSVSSPDFSTFWKSATDINGAPTAPGETIQYNLNATNTGSVTATNVLIVDAIPNNTDFVVGSATAATAGTIAYSNNNGVSYLYTPMGVTDPYVTHIQYTYASLLVNAAATPSFRVLVDPALGNGIQILNQASMTSTETGLTTFLSDDPALPGGNDLTSTTITAQPDYTSSSKTATVNGAAATSFVVGDSVTYTMTITDTGNDVAGSTNITVTDTLNINVLDMATVVLSALPAGWAVVGPDAQGVIAWNATTFAQNSTATFSVTATAKAGLAQGTTLDNSISITSNEVPIATVKSAPQLSIPQTTVSGVVYSGNVSNGVANVTVALQIVGSTIDTVNTLTNANGAYALPAPNAAGPWEVRVTDASSILSGFNLVTGFVNPLAVTLTSGATLANQNFAYEINGVAAQVKGRIFDDVNGDGVEDAGDNPFASVTLELRTSADVLLASVTTDVAGDYTFDNVAQGDYRLVLTDTGNVLNNRYLTTGLASPVVLSGLVSGSISTVNFGYRLGSQIGDLIYDDANVNGLFDAGETGIPNVLVQLQQGGLTVYSSNSDNNGIYTFFGVAEGSYNLVVTDPYTGIANAAVAITVVAGVNQLNLDYGFNATPAITVAKSVASPIVGHNALVEYTITVTNAGGAAANFRIKDVLPNTSPLVIPAPTYTASAGSFLYLNTSSVLLNGNAFTIPTVPLQFSTQPIWSGFTMPGNSILTITFAAFSDAIDGTYYNGVQYLYNNGINNASQLIVDAPDLVNVVVSTAGILKKTVTAVNGAAWTNGEPMLLVGDTVTYTVSLINSAAALAQTVSQFTETMPAGLSYVANSTVIVAPLNQPAAAIAPVIVGQLLTWTMPVPNPSTVAANALSQVTLSFDLLVGLTATSGSHTDVATATILVVGSITPLVLSTGDTAPVTVSQPILSMTKTSATPLISSDNAGNYTPVSYALTISNSGGSAATGVVLTDTLPTNFTFNTGTMTRNGVLMPASNVTFNQVGAILTITFNIDVPAKVGVTDGKVLIGYTVNIAAAPTVPAGSYTNSVTLASTNGGNLTAATASIELIAIQMGKSTSTANVNKGGVAKYVITVMNNGTTAVNAIDVSDILPTGFTYKAGSTVMINGASTTTADPAGTPRTPKWTLNSLNAGVSATIDFYTDVSATMNAGTYYNTIQASNAGGSRFPNPGPTAPVVVTAALPLLSVTKSSDVASAAPGAVITYKVLIKNTGPGQASTVIAVDDLSVYTQLGLDAWGVNIPVKITDGSALVPVLSNSGVALGNVDFSTDGGTNYVTLSAVTRATLNVDAYGFAQDITDFKVNLTGTMNANTTTNPAFTLEYKVQVK